MSIAFDAGNATSYAYGRWCIRSAEPLPELAVLAPTRRPDYELSTLAVRQPDPAEWFYDVDDVDNSTCFLRVAKSKDAYLLDFPGLARFVVQPAYGSITAHREAATTAPALRHLLLDHVLPRLLSLRGVAVLHATAVRAAHGSIAFLGPSGYGKSTLALSLALVGHPLQADDCLILEPSVAGKAANVIPSYNGGRLWSDVSAALGGPATPGKHALDVPFDPTPSPLVAVFVLGVASAGDAISIERLPARAAFVELVGQGFHLDPSGPAANTDLFEAFSTVAACTPTFLLGYPRTLERLADVRHAVLGAVANARRRPPSPNAVA